MKNKNFYIISYDISDEKRLKRVAKFLEDWGERKQKSVFECWLTEEELKQVKEGLKEIINPKEDRVRFYSLCKSCREKTQTFGLGRLPEDPKDIQII